MTHVEDDQRWGVTAAEDSSPTTALKNGWLALDSDDGNWVINTVGITTVHGDPVLIAVLTDHQATQQSGIRLAEALSQVAARAVAPSVASGR